MSFPQVIAAFHALFDVIGLPGNFLVIVTIVLESRFHVMRYILLASLALSDSLLLVLVNSLRIKSIAQEKWLYGQTMCYLNPFFVRYFYINTVLHLVAVSYDRYLAIVKSSQVSSDVRWHHHKNQSSFISSHLDHPYSTFHWSILWLEKVRLQPSGFLL